MTKQVVLINNIVSYNSSDICSAFAEHFGSIGKTLHKKFLMKRNLHDYKNKIPRLVQFLYLNQTNEWEVKKLIKKLPNKTSSGYDNINNIIKNLSNALAGPLNHIFNHFISQGIFPNTMKITEIIPLFKCNDSSIVNNNRHFSLLITMSKMLENIIYNRLYSFLKKNNILFESQYGF